MSDDKNKIISIHKYLKKKQEHLNNKQTSKEESESSSDSKKSSFSNIINMSQYLKTRSTDKSDQKELTNQSGQEGKILFLSKKDKESNPEPKKLQTQDAKILVLDDYLKRKQTQVTRSYPFASQIAAALLAVFFISVFYQNFFSDNNPNRELASVKNNRTPQSDSESMNSNDYAKHIYQNKMIVKSRPGSISNQIENNRTPQSTEERLSPSQYIKYLNKNKIIKKSNPEF